MQLHYFKIFPVKRTIRSHERKLLQEKERKAEIAQEVGISEQKAAKLEELIFQRIVLNPNAMGPFDYYLNVKERSPEKVKAWDVEICEAIKNPKYRLFIELMLVERYNNSPAAYAEAYANSLTREANATRAEIESENRKIIPFQRRTKRKVEEIINIA